MNNHPTATTAPTPPPQMPKVDLQFRSWRLWLLGALVAGLWLVPVILFGTEPGTMRDALALGAGLSGVVARAT